MTIRATPSRPRNLRAKLRATCLALLLASGAYAPAAHAQMAASLVADNVALDPDGRLTARGNVEAFHAGTRLQASAITYNRATDRLTIEGPILVTLPDGTIFTARAADLDPQLQNGILQSARVVLDQQLQMAANQISRVDGRYSQLSRVAVTSCAVCGTEAPLWDIRAARVTHDEDAQQLYFEDAVFRVRGMPIFWLPAMRLPDPTLDRASGVLIPDIRMSDRLGLGLAVPYFITLGPTRDLRLTPYLSPHTRTLEMAFRQALPRGHIDIGGAVSRDSLQQGDTRAYATVSGATKLSYGFDVAFDFITVSDRSYLLDYDISDRERLASTLILQRVEADSLFKVDLTAWTSLREGESSDSLPPLISGAIFEQRHPAGDGQFTWGGELLAFARTHDGSGEMARDVARLSAEARWRQQWITDHGLVFAARAGLEGQWRGIGDDPAVPETQETLIPTLGATLSWPLARSFRNGGVQIFEPVAALSWSQLLGDTPVAEDSGLSEFDEGNLFALTRSAGGDRFEEGLHLALGARWSHVSANGDTLGLTFGRLLREGANAAGYTPSSGLADRASDWLVAGELTFANGLSMQGRSLIRDEAFTGGQAFGKTEARLGWDSETVALSAAYVWLPADLAEDRLTDQSEWTLSGAWQINETWGVNGSGRYDISADRPARAGLGVSWSNECVTVDVSLARRYTQTETADTSTSLGLSVTLNGFSAGRSAARSADCNG